MSYKFNLRFKFPHSSFIDDDSASVKLNILNGAHEIFLESRPPEKEFKKANTFDVFGNGFASKDEAISLGRRTRDTIAVCCALARTGVELTKQEQLFDLADMKKTEDGQSYIQPKDMNGLIVCPQEAKLTGVFVAFGMKAGQPLKRFHELFTKSFGLSENLNPKLSLAFELYNAHFFEASVRAKFLQLISVVECLAEQKPIKANIIKYIECLAIVSKEELQSLKDISKEEVDYFIQRLHNLKRESIAVACRNLIKKHLCAQDIVFFKECYNVRSNLVHNGTIKDGADLISYFHKLETLVIKLLQSIITKNINV